MTRDDIVRMAQEVGMDEVDPGIFLTQDDELERFAALIIRHKALDQITACGQYEQGFEDGKAAEREAMINDGWRQCAKGQRTTQFCGAAEQARADEREACAQIAWDRFGTAGREIAGTIRKRGK